MYLCNNETVNTNVYINTNTKVGAAGVPGSISGPAIYFQCTCIYMLIPPFLLH